jgi:glycerophosphoryl diester phosphodiesterase
MALMERVPLSGAAFARDSNATAEFIATLHDAGLEVLIYTVNEPRLIRRAIDFGADGIISDYPERVPKIRLK